MRSVVDALAGNPVAIAVPLFDDDRRLLGVGDVLRGSVSSLVDSIAAPDAERFRQELSMARELAVEACAEKDDELLALVLTGASVPGEALMAALRRQTLAGSIVPVVAGSALVGVGVDILLDAVGELLPSLGDRDRRGVEAWFPPPAEDAQVQALVFKVEHRQTETVAYARVFDGRIARGDWLWRSGDAEPFQALDLWTPQASARQPRSVAMPGEIVELAVPASTRTGDTLVARAGAQALLGCEFPAPVISILLEPSDPRAIDSLRQALDAVLADDPTLEASTDLETGLPIVSGLGELHLEIVAERVEELAKCQVRRSRPRVAVRWRLSGEGKAHAAAGNSGQHSATSADVCVRPRVEGSGCSVDIGDAVPTHLAERTEAIVRAWLRNPGRIGGEVVDAEVRVDRIVLENGDDHGEAYAAAVEDALGLAVARAGCHRLEPLVNFRVHAPEDAGSVVLADLHLRKAEIREVSSGSLGAVVEGAGTLRSFLGYATRLRSLTKGLGEVDLQISGFGVVSATEGPLPAQN
jgi:elongation factor G